MDANKQAILTSQQVRLMLTMQISMNTIVNPRWMEAGYDWQRAIMMEGAEAVEHHGWKWWKKQTPDMPQLRMELVDIWHFLLSHIAAEVALDRAVGRIMDYAADPIEKEDPAVILEALENLIGQAAHKQADLRDFVYCMGAVNLSWPELFDLYVGKNCLNTFRQAHGYKTGEYIKDWSSAPLQCAQPEGRTTLEDNDHLHDIMMRITCPPTEIQSYILTELEARYAQVRSMSK